jgi:hypothetical protein
MPAGADPAEIGLLMAGNLPESDQEVSAP